MTDDDRLAELFRAAASDAGAPRPGFDHADVLTASRRITARRRSAVIGGSLALFAVLGVGGAVAWPAAPETASTAAAPALAERNQAAQPPAVDQSAAGGGAAEAPRVAAGAGPEAAPAPAAPDAARSAAAAAGPPFTGVPLGPAAGDCAARQDPALRAYLDQALPAVAGAPAALGTAECLPGGERHVSVEVDDGGRRGVLGVTYLPPGTAARPVDPAATATTASGGTVTVSSVPADGGAPAPFVDRLAFVAGYLASRL